MPIEEIPEISLILNGKEYSLNTDFKEVKLQPKDMEQKALFSDSEPITITWKLSRKCQARLNKLESKLKKYLKKLIKIHRFKFAI